MYTNAGPVAVPQKKHIDCSQSPSMDLSIQDLPLNPFQSQQHCKISLALPFSLQNMHIEMDKCTSTNGVKIGLNLHSRNKGQSPAQGVNPQNCYLLDAITVSVGYM